MTRKAHIILFSGEELTEYLDITLPQLLDQGYLYLSNGRYISLDDMKIIGIDNDEVLHYVHRIEE